MTCADARHFILTADPSVLRDRSDAGFREHVAGCAECAAAAGHVVADVFRLRAALIARGSRAVPVRPRRSTKRVAMTLVPVALAAELALFAFLGNRDTVNPLLDKPVMMDDTVAMLRPVAHTPVDTREVKVAPKKTSRAKAVKRVAMANDSARDAADTTKRVSAPSEYMSAEEMAQLQVTPASRRQRLAVIATSDPKITVIWLTRVDSL